MSILSMALLIAALFLLYRSAYRRFWDKGLAYRLEFSASEAFEGEKLTLIKELANAKPLPLPWVTAKAQTSRSLIFGNEGGNRVSDDYYQNDLFSMGMYQRVTRNQEFICGRRGYYRIKSVDLSANDFLTGTKTVKRLQSGAALTVFPKLISIPELQEVFKQVYGEIEARSFVNPDPFAFQGIREYQSHDDFRFINWKATARTGLPMVNVNASTYSRELVVLLGLEPYREWPEEEVLEEGIRIAASAAEYFTSCGIPIGVVSNGRDIASKNPLSTLPGSGMVHFYSILDMLARIDISLGQPPMSEIVAGIRDTKPFYLLISSYDREDLADAFEALVARGADARWIIPVLEEERIRIATEGSARITRWETQRAVIPLDSIRMG